MALGGVLIEREGERERERERERELVLSPGLCNCTRGEERVTKRERDNKVGRTGGGSSGRGVDPRLHQMCMQ